MSYLDMSFLTDLVEVLLWLTLTSIVYLAKIDSRLEKIEKKLEEKESRAKQ